jgi:hypothetical protein
MHAYGCSMLKHKNAPGVWIKLLFVLTFEAQNAFQ